MTHIDLEPPSLRAATSLPEVGTEIVQMVAIVGFDLKLVRNVSTVVPCPKVISH